MADAVRPKVFICYHHADQKEADAFAEDFADVFIARMLGVSDSDDFIDSTDADYVIKRIREKYLTDSTVTIVLIGACTWARRYVDWEIASTLRNDPVNKRSGLLAINLASLGKTGTLPDRLKDNLDGENGYARWWVYPTGSSQLRNWIEIALDARDTKTPDNSRNLRERSATC
jgi:hypothetical protein